MNLTNFAGTNFAGMLASTSFGKAKPAEQLPSPMLLAKRAARRLASLKEAGDVLRVLPGPGESLHAIMTGRYDLTDLLESIIRQLGTVAHLRIATLSFNRNNVNQIKAWIDAGAVKRLSLLCSRFFFEHNPDTFREMQSLFRKGDRIAASRNHCKVCCLQFSRGRRKLTLEGSANLRTNSNREQFCLVDDAKLHDWHAQWIDEQIHGNPVDESEGRAKS